MTGTGRRESGPAEAGPAEAGRRGTPGGARAGDRGPGDHGRTLANAPWKLWAWPYGAAVLVITLLYLLVPAGWLWLPIAAAAGFLVARRTWSHARTGP